MLPLICLLAIVSQISAYGFGFGSQMSSNGFKFGFPSFGSWPSNSAVVGNVRERFDQMFKGFGRDKPGLKTKIRKENNGARKVTTVTQDGKGYHSFTRYSSDNPSFYGKAQKGKGKGQVQKSKHLKPNLLDITSSKYFTTAWKDGLLNQRHQFNGGLAAFNQPNVHVTQLSFERPMDVNPQQQCSGHTRCLKEHFCNPLLNICQRIQQEGSTCQFKNQCGPPEIGIVCIWGRCSRAIEGSLGSFCIKDSDCILDSYCTMHQSISPFYPMCTPKLDEGATCGQPKLDLSPMSFIGSLFGSKCDVEKPSPDYCRSGLKCAPVGWFGNYVCVPESLKVTPYSCPDNTEENTIGGGIYPQEPVTEEILEQEIEDKIPDHEEGEEDKDNELQQMKEMGESSLGTTPQPQRPDVPMGDNNAIAIGVGTEKEEKEEDALAQQGADDLAQKIQSLGQGASEKDDENANQLAAAQTAAELAQKIKEMGKEASEKEPEETETGEEESEEKPNEADENIKDPDTSISPGEDGESGEQEPEESSEDKGATEGSKDETEVEEQSGNGEEGESEASQDKLESSNAEEDKSVNKTAETEKETGKSTKSGDSEEESKETEEESGDDGYVEPTSLPSQSSTTPTTSVSTQSSSTAAPTEEASNEDDGESGADENSGDTETTNPKEANNGSNPTGKVPSLLYPPGNQQGNPAMIPPASPGKKPPPQQPPPKSNNNAQQVNASNANATQDQGQIPAQQQPVVPSNTAAQTVYQAPNAPVPVWPPKTIKKKKPKSSKEH